MSTRRRSTRPAPARRRAPKRGTAARKAEPPPPLELVVPPRLLERRENALASLFELSEELSASRDPFAMGTLALLNALGHFGASRAALWAFPSASGPAVPLAVLGITKEEAGRLGPALRAALEASSATGPAAPPHGPMSEAFAIVVPILARGKRTGAFALGARVSGEAYERLDREYLNTAARMMGVALEHARLVHRMEEANRQLRRANSALTESDRLKAEFVANVNHEMRTPVTILKGYLDTLTSGTPSSELYTRALKAMKTQTDQLARMVQDLLEFSSLAERPGPVACAPVDVGTLVTRYADERRPGVLGGLRTLEVEIAPDLPAALADPERVERAIDALVENALKFTPVGARITLRAGTAPREPQGRWVRVEVVDDGPGIPQECLPAMFDPFRQGDGSSTRTVGGMGLGLALARAMIEKMEGRLEAESAFGAGATFRILLAAA